MKIKVIRKIRIEMDNNDVEIMLIGLNRVHNAYSHSGEGNYLDDTPAVKAKAGDMHRAILDAIGGVTPDD